MTLGVDGEVKMIRIFEEVMLIRFAEDFGAFTFPLPQEQNKRQDACVIVGHK